MVIPAGTPYQRVIDSVARDQQHPRCRAGGQFAAEWGGLYKTAQLELVSRTIELSLTTELDERHEFAPHSRSDIELVFGWTEFLVR